MKKTGALAGLVAAFAALGLAACNVSVDGDSGSGSGGSVTLDFEVAAELTAEVGNYFSVPDANCIDSAGNMYFPKVQVLNAAGEEVLVEDSRFFVLDVGEYRIRYSVEFDGEEIVKETIVRSSDTAQPVIELERAEVYTPQGSEYIIPEAEYSDNYTPVSDLKTGVNVTFGGETVDVEDGKFSLSEAGEYVVEYTAEDGAGNVGSARLTVNSFAREEGNLSYFNREFGAENTEIFIGLGAVSPSQEKTIPGEDYALKYEVAEGAAAAGAVGGFYLDPYITDISEYEYLYFWAYTDQADVGITFNNVWSSHRLTAGIWTKIVLTRNADGTNYTTPWGTNVFNYDGSSAVTPDDMNDFLLMVYLPGVQTDLYLSAIRGTNEMVSAEVAMPEVCGAGESLAIPQAEVPGAEIITQKVYVMADGKPQEVTGGSYTFAEEGEYTFIFEVTADGKLVDSVQKAVRCYTEEEGNLTYFNREFGTDGLRPQIGYEFLSSTQEKALPGEDYALKYEAAANAGVTGGFYLNPYIRDISGYKYLYFWVYTDLEDIGVTFNNVWSGNRLTAGVWTRIVLTRTEDGTNYTTPWGTNVFNYDDPSTATPTDMTNFLFMVYHPQGGAGATTLYISAIRATNELPTAVVETEAVYWTGEEYALPEATVAGAKEVSQKVWLLENGVLTEISGNTYTFPKEGEYTFRFEVTADGMLVDVVEKTVVCYEYEEGNITYFNRGFGSEGLKGLMGVEYLSSSQEKTVAGDDYALKYEAAANTGASGGFYLHPYIRDISGYKYLYFWVYTETPDVGITFNNVWSGNRLTAGVWTRIVLTRTEDGTNYTTPWGTNAFNYDGSTTATPTDMTNFLFMVYHPADTSLATTLYISTIRGTNELPFAEVNTDGTYWSGEEYALPTATVAGAEEVSQKVWLLENGELTEIPGGTYTFEKGGEYTLVFEVTADGMLVDVLVETIAVRQYEEGNLTYFDESFGTEGLRPQIGYEFLSSAQEKTVAGDEYVLRYEAAANAGATGGFYINPLVKDISGYKYLYFWVYTDIADIGVTFNNIWSGNRLTAGVWTRIVLTRTEDGTNYTTPWGTNVFNYDGSTTATPTDMADFLFMVYHPQGGAGATTLYISTIRMTNEYPLVAAQPEEGNLAYFDESFGADSLRPQLGNEVLSASQEKTLPGEDYSLKFEAPAQIWPTSGFYFDSYIKDISGYQYLYFWVYTDQSDVGLTFNNQWSGYKFTPGEWTQVVLTRNADGSNYTTPWGTSVFAPGDTVTPQNMTNFLVMVYQPEGGASPVTVYFSTIRATNELPPDTPGTPETEEQNAAAAAEYAALPAETKKRV